MKWPGQRISILLGVILLAGACGTGSVGTMPTTIPPPSPAVCVPASPGEFAYALNGDSVSMYSVDSCTGGLTPIVPASVATGSTPNEPAPEDMISDPKGRFVYVANLVSNAADLATISMYAVDSTTGTLTPTTPGTVATGFLPQGIGIDPSGRFVYTANSDDNTISMFAIDQTTGQLKPTTPAAVAAGWGPDSVTVHPSGRFAYVANQVDDTISMYAINAGTGILTPMTPATVKTGFSPFGIAVDPSGRFAYVPNTYDPQNTISQYAIDPSSGILTPNPNGTVSAGNQPTAVVVDPSTKYAYVTNRVDNTISAFRIDPVTGGLSPLGTTATGGSPFRVVVDPSGKFVYAVNEDSAISIFALGADGVLTSAGTAQTPNGGSLALAVIPAKK